MAKPLEFKGRMLSLTRVRVLDPDVAAIDMQLAEFARQMPQAVAGMPVIIESDHPFDVGVVLASLRQVGMQPLAVTDGVLNESARMWGLAVLPPDSGKGMRMPAAEAPAPPPARSAAVPAAAGGQPAARRTAKMVHEPLRGGQQVYAADADLIVTNTVNAGSEAIADGCVHIYGALRGRAIAGAKGDSGARIFCRRFEAELVAVAGVYAVAEQMQGDLKGKPVQAYLLDGKLKIERLEW
jgi:septum site-determining protein MinC